MWLDNFNARRPAVPSAEPLTCERLGAVTVPTLAVGAEYGMPYSRRIVEMLAECIPGSRLVVIPAVTHFMSYQVPDLFNQAVLNSLRSVDEDSRLDGAYWAKTESGDLGAVIGSA